MILTKCFLKILGQSHKIIMIILMLSIIPFFFCPFDCYFLAPLKTFFDCKFLKDIITLLSMKVIWFRLHVQKYYSSCQDFKFFGFSVGTLFSHIWFLLHFLCIWQGNSKSNGGRISLIRLLNKFLISVNEYLQKILLKNPNL